MGSITPLAASKRHGYNLIYFGLLGLPEFQQLLSGASSNADLDAIFGDWGFPAEFRDEYFLNAGLQTAQRVASKIQSLGLGGDYPVSGCAKPNVRQVLAVIACS